MRSIIRKIDGLSRMTVANGCTAAEAAVAQAKLSNLLEECPSPSLLSTEEVRVIRRAREIINREGSREEDFSTAHSTLVAEFKRRHPHIKHAEACKAVNDALEKLLQVKMREKKTSRWRRPIWVAEQQ